MIFPFITTWYSKILEILLLGRLFVCFFSLKWGIIRKDWIRFSLSFVTAKKVIFSVFWDKSRYGGVLFGIHIRNAKVFFYIFCSVCLLKCVIKLLHMFLIIKFYLYNPPKANKNKGWAKTLYRSKCMEFFAIFTC